MSTLAKVLESMIKRGNTEGLETKLDIFFASGKIDQEEYDFLINLLKN